MRIGIIALSLNRTAKPGFYNSQELGLGKALSQRGHSAIVYKLIDRSLLAAPKTETLSSTLQYTMLPAVSLGINGFFKKSFLDASLDALICFSDTQPYTASIARFCKKHKIRIYPYIGVISSTSTASIKRCLMNLMTKRLIHFYRNQPVVWGKTPAICTQLNRLGIENTLLIPVGLDKDLLQKNYKDTPKNVLKEKWGYAPSDKVILFIGRLTSEKEPLEMISLFARAYRQDPGLRLCMVGKGELKEQVESAIADNHLESIIRLIPSIPNDRIWEIYRISHCFINLNRHEIYGMAILEAMYYECPVIAYHAPGPDFILGSSGNILGHLVSSGEELLEALSSLKTIPAKSVNAAHNAVVNQYFWETIANRLPL